MMYFLLHLTLLCTCYVAQAPYVSEPLEGQNLTVYDVSDRVVTMFGLDIENPRIKDLKEKLEKISSYIVNNKLVADVLGNVTSETNLTETNFYNALNENDHFKYLSTNESKSLYLTLKEKMTRDDILNIVAERGERKKLVKSARRMMQDPLPKEDDEEMMNDVVDKMIGEAPQDSHKLKKNESIYWGKIPYYSSDLERCTKSMKS